MRKPVIILLCAAYLLSIVVITFFGAPIEIDHFNVYMTGISFTEYDKEEYETHGDKVLYVPFNSNEGYASVYLKYKIAPDNATHPEQVEFTISDNIWKDKTTGEETVAAEVHKNGEVVFYRPRMKVKVTVKTTDGSKLSDSIWVVCYKP